MNVKDMDTGVGKAEVSNTKNYYRNARKGKKTRNYRNTREIPKRGMDFRERKKICLCGIFIGPGQKRQRLSQD